jgi:site-specific recombinase XerD
MAAATLEQAMKRFQRYLEVERNLASTTRTAYDYDLGRFQEFLIGHLGRCPHMESITTDHIRIYLEHLQTERSLKTATMQRVISSLRGFFRWCMETEQLTRNPALPLRNPKQIRKLPVYLVEGELQSLLTAESADSRPAWMIIRDRSILVTLAFTGMRRQELVDLHLQSVDFASKSIRVFGKGRKERMIPLSSAVESCLREWLEVRPASPLSQALFVSNRRSRLTGRQILNVVREAVQRAGIDYKNISPHKLRHTFATLLHTQDVDIVEIKTLLGHASITSTQIYTHTNPGRLQGAVDQLARRFSGESD